MEAGYHTRPMTRAEVAKAVDWAAAEGWNPGLHDADTFQAADPGGFWAGILDGEPVASISLVRYGAHFAFLGLYIVQPACRGRGFGWRLWRDAMASVAGRQVGLDGVLAQQDNYRKSGFAPAWRNVRHEGRGLDGPGLPRGVLPLLELPFDTVNDYDRPFFAADRAAFLRGWLRQPDAAAFGFVADGQLRGYGVIRRCRSGWKIGPLAADGEKVAQVLYDALAGQAGVDEPVFLDLPQPNAAAVALARRNGMEPVFETARMYTGQAPLLPLARLYGVASFELG
jgi:hypothetical protein